MCIPVTCEAMDVMCCDVSGFIQDFWPGMEIRFFVFLNMYSLLCFPLVLLLSFIR